MKNAFTLVELAIVLVIIGLLVGGVLAGQELIQQSRLNKVISEFREHQTSAATFFAKYNCIPGDCRRAYSFLGSTCGTDTILTTGNPGGCNGDGNKLISFAEGQEAWQHLGIAGLTKGEYAGGYTATALVGTVFPPGPMNNGGFGLLHTNGYQNASCCFWDPGLGLRSLNAITYGTDRVALQTYTRGPAMSGSDTYRIDLKIDDGRGNRGIFTGINSMNSLGVQSTCDYTLQDNDIEATGCVLIYNLGL